MTVPAGLFKEEYIGNNVTTEFSYGWRVFSKDQLLVRIRRADGTINTITDFEITGVGRFDGGTIKLSYSPPPQERIFIMPNYLVEQLTDLRNQGRFYPETIEDEFDRQTFLHKQTQENMTRVLQRQFGLENFDAENRRITNAADPEDKKDLVNKQYLEDAINQLVIDIAQNKTEYIYQTATGAELVDDRFVFDEIQYETGKLQVLIFQNGSVIFPEYAGVETGDYEEDSTGSVKILADYDPDDEFFAIYGKTIAGSLSLLASNVIFNNSGTILNSETVQAAIAELAGISGSKTFSSFSAAKAADNSNLSVIFTTGYYSDSSDGKGIYIKRGTGTAGATDDGSYFVDAAGNRFELLHNGTVTIEQFGAKEGQDIGKSIEKAALANGVKTITTALSNVVATKIQKVDSTKTVDGNNVTVSWEGNYDVYDEYGLTSTDRSIGFLTAKGTISETILTVTSVVEDKTNLLTLADASSLSEGDFLQLNISYPRRDTTQVCKVLSVNGNDVKIDYQFAWSVDSLTVQKFTACVQPVFKNFKIVNNVNASSDSHKISGVGFQWCDSPLAENIRLDQGDFPVFFTRECYNPQSKRIVAYEPKDVSGGRGYVVQINRSQPFNVSKCIGYNARHVWDSSGGSNGVVKDCVQYENRDSDIFAYTTHGEYEHDIDIMNCWHIGGDVSISLARAGADFGEANKRINVIGGHYSGALYLENCIGYTIKSTYVGGLGSAGHRIGTNGQNLIEDVEFQPGVLFRITEDDTPSNNKPRGSVTIRNCGTIEAQVRTTFTNGDICFENTSVVGEWDFSPVDAENPTPKFPQKIVFENCHTLAFSDTSDVRADEIHYTGSSNLVLSADIEHDTSHADAGKVVFSGGKLTASVSNARLRCLSEVISLNGTVTENSAGVVGVAETKKFNLNGVIAVEPDSSNSIEQFVTASCSNCIWVVSGVNIDYTGTGNPIDFIGSSNTNTKAIVSGSYIDGDVLSTDASVTLTQVGNDATFI